MDREGSFRHIQVLVIKRVVLHDQSAQLTERAKREMETLTVVVVVNDNLAKLRVMFQEELVVVGARAMLQRFHNSRLHIRRKPYSMAGRIGDARHDCLSNRVCVYTSVSPNPRTRMHHCEGMETPSSKTTEQVIADVYSSSLHDSSTSEVNVAEKRERPIDNQKAVQRRKIREVDEPRCTVSITGKRSECVISNLDRVQLRVSYSLNEDSKAYSPLSTP